MPFALLILTSFLSLARAQYSEQPAKESHTDLRLQTVLFSIEIPDDHKTYILERTSGQDYFLRRKFHDEEMIQKIAGREAVRIDRDFASRFLRCQYEIQAMEGKCIVTLRLRMKGEAQDICGKDDKKSREMSTIVTELAKRF